jgi:hypothetical protein
MIGVGSVLCIVVCCCAAGMASVQSNRQRTIMGMLILGFLALGSVYLGGYLGLPCSLLGIAAMERAFRYKEAFVAGQATPLIAAISVSGVFLYLMSHLIGANAWLAPLTDETPRLSQLLPLGALALAVILTRTAPDVGE